MEFLIVFLGGGLGSAGRHGTNLLAARLFGVAYPVGTLCINVLGSFLMGVVVEYFALKSGLSQQLRLFLATGILGGFTTFSTFSLEAALLNSRGEPGAAVLYIAASIVLGVGALYLGLAAVRLALHA
ncbi:MAG TPA: fluoride efflux transporter CrcB [Steroidobacteraceae bacterium]|jgi:CrcB protein